MNVKENAKSFYPTTKQVEALKEHKRKNRISTSKQIKMMINFVFGDKERLDEFNKFVNENKGDLI